MVERENGGGTFLAGLVARLCLDRGGESMAIFIGAEAEPTLGAAVLTGLHFLPPRRFQRGGQLLCCLAAAEFLVAKRLLGLPALADRSQRLDHYGAEV